MTKEEAGTALSVSGGASAALWYLGWCVSHTLLCAWLMGGSVVVLFLGLMLLTSAYRD